MFPLLLVPVILAAAQAPVPDTRPQNPVLPATAPSGKPIVNVLLRERANATQWFGALPNAETYGHGDSLLRVAIPQRLKRFDYQLEMSNSAELALPTDAVRRSQRRVNWGWAALTTPATRTTTTRRQSLSKQVFCDTTSTRTKAWFAWAGLSS